MNPDKATKRLNFKKIFLQCGTVFLVAACFSIPFSTSMMGGFSLLAFLFWILSGRIATLPKLVLTNGTVAVSLLLFLLLAVGVAYSPIPFGDGLSYLKKYRELLFFIMTVSLFFRSESSAKAGQYAFVTGCIVLLIISWLMYFEVIPTKKYGYSTVYHITHSLFMSVLAFWCLQQYLSTRKYLTLWSSIFFGATINLLCVTPGRTGMLIYFSLILLTLLQHFSWKRILPALTALCLFFGATYFISDNFSGRIKEAVTEIETYQAGSSRTSLGMRFDWWQNSLTMIEQKPLYGYGTGSFQEVQKEMIKGTRTMPTDNPHNEYLLLATQAGLPGAILFVLFLLLLLSLSSKLPTPERYLLQGVVVATGVGCLMNSFLFDSQPGHFFAIISATLCAPAIKDNQYRQKRILEPTSFQLNDRKKPRQR